MVTWSPLLSVTVRSRSSAWLTDTVKPAAVASFTSPLEAMLTVTLSRVSLICAVAVAPAKLTASKLPPLTPLTVAVMLPGST